jgi:mRNA-degrading endonuclease RelE of RelBE toxin-antitoxin system
MNFNVKLTNTAQKELRRLPTKVKRQVANALLKIGNGNFKNFNYCQNSKNNPLNPPLLTEILEYSLT